MGSWFPSQGLNLASPALEGGFLTTDHQRSPQPQVCFLFFFLMATNFNVTVLISLEERYQGVFQRDHGTCISCRTQAEILQALQLRNNRDKGKEAGKGRFQEPQLKERDVKSREAH